VNFEAVSTTTLTTWVERFRRLAELTTALAWRDIAGRYRGANLGILWTVLNPLLMLAVYGIAFGYVFRSRWPGVDGHGSYVEVLFIGLAVHGFVAECLTRAPGVIASNPSFVKRVVFPLGILPAVMGLVALFNFTAIIGVFIGYQLFAGDGVSTGHLLLPVVIVPMLLMGLTFSYLLAFLGVYFRDLNQMMPTIAAALLFLSSAIVPVSTLPSAAQFWFKLNPITFLIDQARNILIWRQPLDWEGLGLRVVAWGCLLCIAIYFFRRARKGFADVI
jgi:lipopolysaccharide transport system permease protein